MYRDAQRAFQRKQIQLELLLKDLLETEIHNREFTAKHRDPETGLYRMPAEEKAAGKPHPRTKNDFLLQEIHQLAHSITSGTWPCWHLAYQSVEGA